MNINNISENTAFSLHVVDSCCSGWPGKQSFFFWGGGRGWVGLTSNFSVSLSSTLSPVILWEPATSDPIPDTNPQRWECVNQPPQLPQELRSLGERCKRETLLGVISKGTLMGHLRDPEVAFQKLGSRGTPRALLRAVLCLPVMVWVCWVGLRVEA